MADIVSSLPDEVVLPALRYPGIGGILVGAASGGGDDPKLARAIEARLR
jgi:hypothetical protein